MNVANGWLGVEVVAVGEGPFYVSIEAFDEHGRPLGEPVFDDDVRNASMLARYLEARGASPEEARRWADDFTREARGEPKDTKPEAGRKDLAMTAVVLLAGVGVWAVGLGFLAWLVVTRVF